MKQSILEKNETVYVVGIVADAHITVGIGYFFTDSTDSQANSTA